MDKLTWAVYQRPCRGEDISGDAFLVQQQKDKGIIALMDGLGHGEKAAQAAQQARKFLQTTAIKDGRAQIQHLHQLLRPTRGTVLGLVHIDFKLNQLCYWGIGNIRAQLRKRTTVNLISAPGVVGYNLNKIICQTSSFHLGDLLVMTTDGIQGNWDWYGLASKLERFTPANIATYLGQQYAIFDDDATVLVVQRVN